MFKYVLLLFSVFYNIQLFAQIEAFTEMEWGVVPESDLEMEVYPLDSTAKAVVLNHEGHLIINSKNVTGFAWVLYRHKRIKILDEVAIDQYSTVSMVYNHYSGVEQLRQIKAHTILPDGTVVEVNKKEIFKEKINDKWTKITFAMPNVVVGSVIEYRYQLRSDRFFTPDEWTFREEIPVKSSYFKFTNNSYSNYAFLIKGSRFMKTEILGKNHKKHTLGDMTLINKGEEFYMTNGSALTQEPFITTLDDYRISVKFQVSFTDAIFDESSSFKETWGEVSNELLKSPLLGRQFTDSTWHDQLVLASEKVIDSTANNEQKLNQICQFVSGNIKLAGQTGIYSFQTPNEAYENKEAALATIQYAGLSLLRHYGFEAYPVILSSRPNGTPTIEYPFIDQFDYVILLASFENQLKFIDMSDSLFSPGMVRVEALNHKGFLLREENPIWIDIDMPVYQDVFAVRGEIFADGNIQADVKSTLRSYSAYVDRLVVQEDSLKDIWLDRLALGSVVTEMDVDTSDISHQSLIVKFKLSSEAAAMATGDMIYFSPIVYTKFDENPFKLEKRFFPIDFPFPFEEKSVYSYTIPENYQVVELPEKADIRLPNNDAVFQFQVKESKGKVQAMMIFRVVKTFYTPDEYSALRDLFESAVEKIGEQIVLKKITD